MLLPTVEAMRRKLPLPTRIEAAAILRAYSERSVPLPVQEIAAWYAPGGRYWVLCWSVLGWEREGDKFLGPSSVSWSFPLDVPDAVRFWDELLLLASSSDAWQLAQGADVSPPSVDVPSLLSREVDWSQLFELRPIWRLPTKAGSSALRDFIRKGWVALQEWRKKRQADPSRPILPPPMPRGPGGGTALLVILLGAAILVGGRRNRRRR